VDVSAYLTAKGLHLKRADARNVHTACVFCDEDPNKRGRLYINVDPDAEVPGLFMCFRCGARGSLTALKRHFGDDLNETDINYAVRAEILAVAADYYVDRLVDHVAVYRYLRGPQRGLRKETIRDRQLGYAPMEWIQDVGTAEIRPRRSRALYSYLRDHDYSAKDILATGLCHEADTSIVDALAGMITIPYHIAGNVVAIRGRTWPYTDDDFANWEDSRYDPPKVKYKTCGGTSARLYGVDSLWGQPEVFITEGEFDALVLSQEGFSAVGVPGANTWQDNWDDYFTEMRRVWIVFDRDAAGERAAIKLMDRLGVKARRVMLSEPGQKIDPTDWFANHTVDEFTAIVADARKGSLLLTVADARAEFNSVQNTPGLKFDWELLDLLLTPGIQPGQIMVILAKTGAGKGSPQDTSVPTPSGMRRWGDLVEGDYVFGSDGKPTKVVGIYDRGVLPTYRVTFSDDSFLDTDGDHIWTVMYRYGKHREWATKEITTAELAASDLRLGAEYRFTIPMCSPVEYPERDLSIEPYTLGALIANGHLKRSAVLTTPDLAVVTRIRQHHDVTEHKTPQGACSRYCVRGLMKDLRRLGLTVLSGDKFIPNEYLEASVDQRVALLQGLMDGDGSARAERRSVLYFTSSRRLADDVVRLVTSLGGTAKQSWLQRPGASPEGKLSIMLPDGIEPFSTERKNSQPTMRYRTEPRRAIVDVRPVDPQPIRCITVDAADSLYVVGEQHIVTHNTIILLNLMHRMRVVQPGIKILFISLEQTRGEWWDRARRIHTFYNLDADQDAAERFWVNNITLIDRNRLTEDEVLVAIDDFEHHMGARPDVICLDYLGYWSRSFRGEAYERTSAAIMALKAIGKEQRIPLIVPHQVNRTGRDGEEFGSDAARESGVIEETADFLFGMWRPDDILHRPEGEKSGLVKVRVLKSRHGGRGELLEMQWAPVSLVLVPKDDPLAARARREFDWRQRYHDTWEQIVHRHRTGFEGTLLGHEHRPDHRLEL
jgi:replicative DNA helicase